MDGVQVSRILLRREKQFLSFSRAVLILAVLLLGFSSNYSLECGMANKNICNPRVYRREKNGEMKDNPIVLRLDDWEDIERKEGRGSRLGARRRRVFRINQVLILTCCWPSARSRVGSTLGCRSRIVSQEPRKRQEPQESPV